MYKVCFQSHAWFMPKRRSDFEDTPRTNGIQLQCASYRLKAISTTYDEVRVIIVMLQGGDGSPREEKRESGTDV